MNAKSDNHLHKRQYPKPPFNAQGQAIPGREDRLDPPADHGEKSYQGNKLLHGKVALITGGDSGIGRAVAIAYAREGADIVFTYLSEDEDAEETVEWVRRAGRETVAHAVDQRDEKLCKSVVMQTMERFARIDILVNNAAYQQSYDTLEEIPVEEFDRAFQTNIYAPFYFCRTAMPKMLSGSCVINTASIQTVAPSKGLAPYAASKAALGNFTLSLAQWGAKRGIRVNAVAPGPVWTPLIPSTMPEEKVRNFGMNTLFDRPAQPAELAPVYVFLASDGASYVIGEIYGVTGGRKQL